MNDEMRFIERELSRIAGAWAFAKIVDALILLVGFGLLAWGIRGAMHTMELLMR